MSIPMETWNVIAAQHLYVALLSVLTTRYCIPCPPIIEIHDYMLPVEGDDFTINTTVTTDLPFKKRGCPRWKREKHQSQHRMQKTINCSLQENYTAFLELRIHNFSYANDAGNYTVTAGNACGVSSLPVSFGVDSAPAPDNPSGHGKQLLSRDEIIAISSVGSFFVILIIGFVVMSRRRNNKGVNLSMLSGGSGKNYGTMNRKAKKYRRIFHSIGPLFAENVKVDNLLPYLKQHDLVTNSEAAHLLHQTQSLAPLQINQLLLDCLAEKEIECLNLLLCSLNSEDEHLGHTDVAKELKQLMKTNDIEYEDICPVCNKAIN